MANDIYGQPVPERLEKPFDARATILRLVERMGTIQAELGRLFHEVPGIDTSGAIAALEKAQALALMEAPAAMCDCRSWQYDCPKCKGRRWLNGEMYLLVKPPPRTPQLPASSPSNREATIPTPLERRHAG
jgi:hypothetical protein